MVRDNDLIFSDEQSAALNAGVNADSTNNIRLAAGEDYLGNTKYADISALGEMRLLVTVEDTALAAAVDGAVLTIGLYNHTAASSFASGTKLLEKSVTVNTAGTGATAIGTVLIDLGIPIDEITKEYLGLDIDVATQNISAGKISAMLVDHVEKRSDER